MKYNTFIHMHKLGDILVMLLNQSLTIFIQKYVVLKKSYQNWI